MLKNPPANVGKAGSISELRKSPGEGNDNPLQYSCLGNPMDRGAWQATVHGVTRVEQDLATKPPPPQVLQLFFISHQLLGVLLLA